MTQYVQLKAVNEDGTLRVEAAEPGAQYVIVKAPRLHERTVSRLQKPRAMLDEVFAYVREHRDLGKRQLREFTERYGDPRDKLRNYRERLSPEEFQNRAREFNAYVQTRFEDLGREVETRYERLEHEFDATLERIFGRPAKEPAPAPEAEPAQDAAAEPARDEAPEAEKAEKNA